ncbi:DUF2207 domain-containing protein, partial [Candidatus Saccharibacteria bacterium]|nr:DUF2207 domain-containing protein [Candidatus Saccharibacteria bacterium]
MRRFLLGLFSILTLIFASSTPASAVNTNDFYFTDFTADYYLSKTEEGAGFMQIIENLTAVFPTSNQNHGIDRCIPRKYNGTSILVNPNFTVFRNLKEEPFTTRVDGKFLCLRIGDANQYVHGTQSYTIIYNVENVILEPNNSTYQELYWDANGTGWSQKFQSVTANLHISEDLDSARKSQSDSDISCYAGKYGTSGTAATSRCKFSSELDTESGFSTVITFTADSLKAGETLTFVIEFMPKTFSIKEPDPDYTVYIIIGGVVLICAAIIIYWSVASRKIKDKRNLARNTSVPVQYIPPKGLTVAEAGTVWLKSKKALQVATLMQLAVTHKVELEKGEKKRLGGYDWKIHVKNANRLSEEQEIVLKILNGGHTFHTGDTIKVQRHSSDSSLISLGRSFSKEITKSLRRKHLFEP